MKRGLDSDIAEIRKRFCPGTSQGNSLLEANDDTSLSREEFWMVQWRNPQYKKHKTWDGDGVLAVNGSKATMYDLEGRVMAYGKVELPLLSGKNLPFAGKELQLDHSISSGEYHSGICFGKGHPTSITQPLNAYNSVGSAKKFVVPRINSPSMNIKLLPERNPLPLQIVPPAKMDNEITVGSSNWIVNWRKQQGKKHKTWDGDAYVSHNDNKLIMMTEDGKGMGSTIHKGLVYAGYRTYIGGKEVEFDREVDVAQLPNFISKEIAAEDAFIVPAISPSSRSVENNCTRISISTPFIAPNSFYGTVTPNEHKPLHDPDVPSAVVMKSPTKEHIKIFNKKGFPIVPVVLDPVLSRKMRAHQKEGVKFLYECVMGLRKHEGQGCILADEMGLGKTLQTISLVWTLLKQNPYSGAGPVVRKVLIVCPVSLVQNWKAEFHKWLGRDRVGVMACDKDKTAVNAFMNTKTYQVLVIGYERLRTVVNELAVCVHVPPIGLIICDEGHRLKSANNKTTSSFKMLRTPRRILLSGTPIQNDLGEFHAMSEFCNPGLLDDYNTFRRVYETPILKARAPDSTQKEKELGEARSTQLLAISKSFVLRRDAVLLKDYLPPKNEYVVFITPTSLQLSIFSKILHPDKLDELVHSSTAESLALINMLTKISNSPILLRAAVDKANARSSDSARSIHRASVDEALKLLPDHAQIEDMALSGKLRVLSRMLKTIYHETEEKCAIVSHYTSTLNILEAFCLKKGYSYYRLDGQTPQAKRQEYVNVFNKSSQRSSFIFLLSSKAGGVGINLIGASRLCLVDSDWNPSHDLQSMARCHRDGQKRPVYIYRFLTAGTIDEKIYQRQVTKIGLSDSLIGTGDGNSKSDSFTRKDLRDIFRVHTDTGSNTHDLLECPCDGMQPKAETSIPNNELVINEKKCSNAKDGFVLASQVKPGQSENSERAHLWQKKAALAALGEWTHINCLRLTTKDQVKDKVLSKLIQPGPSTPFNGTLLSAIDLDKIIAMDTSARDLPGGTITFLFEKITMSEHIDTSE